MGKFINSAGVTHLWSKIDKLVKGVFTVFTVNGDFIRLTIGGVTKDLKVPYSVKTSFVDSVSKATGSLDDIKDTGHFYYTGGGNDAIEGRPDGVDSYGMMTMRTASSYYGQILIASKAPADLSELYWRTASTFNGGWRKVVDSGNYERVLPQATSSKVGLIKIGSDTVQSVAPNSVSTTSGRTYAVQKDSNGKMVVNVPWANTTYSVATSSSNGLMSSVDKNALDTVVPKKIFFNMDGSGYLDHLLNIGDGTFANGQLGIVAVAPLRANYISTLKAPAGSGVDSTKYTLSLGLGVDTATQSSGGIMSAEDKKKLDGVATTLPAGTDISEINTPGWYNFESLTSASDYSGLPGSLSVITDCIMFVAPPTIGNFYLRIIFKRNRLSASEIWYSMMGSSWYKIDVSSITTKDSATT